MSHCRICNSILDDWEIEECTSCINDREGFAAYGYDDELEPFDNNISAKLKQKD